MDWGAALILSLPFLICIVAAISCYFDKYETDIEE
jgi:hypothetical protein